MRIPAYMLFAVATFGLSACGNSGSDKGDEPGDDDDDTSFTDTATGPTGLTPVDLEPAAIGIALDGGMTAEGQLAYYMYGAGPDIYQPTLVISITDVEYFSLGADDPERRNHVCEFFALFPHVIADQPPIGQAFDYDAASGGTGETALLWFFAEGKAEIYANSVATDEDGEPIYDEYGDFIDAPACTSLFEQGYPDVIEGMHIGVGFGTLTTYLYEEYWESFEDPELAEIEPSITGMYIAINHPTSGGGYDFVPYDWGSGLFFEATVETMDLQDAEGNPFSADVAMATVNTDNTLEYGIPTADAYFRGIPYWYEDYPNLDLSLLKEGVPNLP